MKSQWSRNKFSKNRVKVLKMGIKNERYYKNCACTVLNWNQFNFVIDGHAHVWPFSVFTPKRVFGPPTAKYQPTISIKFYTHLLLYGIHLWADLDCDQRVGGSRPNQNDYVFVILVTHPKSYRDESPRFRRQTVKVEVRTGAIVKNSGIRNSVGGARSKNSIFRVFRVPSTVLHTA